MEKIKKNFGFGFMRLPMKDSEVDIAETKRMVDRFMAAGFNYFDTAHGYLETKSEPALRECLTERYDREEYFLVNKLSGMFFNREEDIRPLFDEQLKACGVEYFDMYLLHAQSRNNYDHYQKCRAYETVFDLKREGKIRHVGISFHDSPSFLDKILNDYPEIEAVQIQFNYLDYDEADIESYACYEVCRRHNKPVIIMEPVKGGNLANLPPKAAQILNDLNGGSNASYAIRFAAGFAGVMMVLSGMSTIGQMDDNISYMQDFKPLDERELAAIEKVCTVLRSSRSISCTKCRYCTDGCPKKIAIPDLFEVYNNKYVFNNPQAKERYQFITAGKAKASDCVGCGQCETVCPQHLKIRELLGKLTEEFE